MSTPIRVQTSYDVAGTMFCGVLSMFGAVFMAVLAIAISKDYE